MCHGGVTYLHYKKFFLRIFSFFSFLKLDFSSYSLDEVASVKIFCAIDVRFLLGSSDYTSHIKIFLTFMKELLRLMSSCQ